MPNYKLFSTSFPTWILLPLLLIFRIATCGIGVSISTPIPILTVQSRDGDVIDCINKMDQPAFKHPLLINHTIQEYPSGMEYEEETKTNIQVWHETGISCPVGTIPIRRDVTNSSSSLYNLHPRANYPNMTHGHKYAIGFQKNREKIYGTRATLNVWDPVVESQDDFSLAQIWLASGFYENGDVNTVEAGWQIFPGKYFDHQPRLFTFWTRDAYNKTGCYSMRCPGFVQTSSIIALEAAITRTSSFGGDQLDITLQIWKDQLTGNWWLGLGLNTHAVGYWPAALFTLLSDHAHIVEWGGEVLYQNTSGMSTTVEMGSGQFANKGFRKAAYFCNLQVAENNHTLLPVQDFGVRADYPNFYTIKKRHNEECGHHFYYGGPGPRLSGVVRGTTLTFSLILIMSFVFVTCV
ncbi:unnamed protein product [Cochlearia groenlandica]